jgi:diaminopimelate epimerase
MRIINADGSEAEMCGNGIRCVAKHVFDNGFVKSRTFSIHTLAGDLEAKVSLDNGKVRSVEINMGAPVLDGRMIPIDRDGKFINSEFEVDGYTLRGNAVSMGNPHFVTFSELGDEDIGRLGPIIEKHPFFPRRTNVEFCKVENGNIIVRVYERGADWTLACGTGACASAVAAAMNGLVPFGEAVDVRLPGGWLRITVDKDMNYVLMEGPADLVFKGETDTDSLEGSQ